MATRRNSKVSNTIKYDMNNKKLQTTNKGNTKNKVINSSKDNIGYLIPIAFIVIILPLIIRLNIYDTPLSEFPWFTANSQYVDFFLYYKQWLFVSVSFIMIIVIAVNAYLNKLYLRFAPVFLPLGIYAILSLLSSILSKYRSISFAGGFEHFESVLVLLGYCLVVYYIYLFVESEQDVKFIINSFIIGIIFFSIIGLSQFIGHDFIRTDIGLRLITPRIYWGNLDTISFNFEENRVYGTLFNPNYVGVYAALILPMLLLLTIFTKKFKHLLMYIIAIIGVSICLIGSQSTAGIISIGVSLILALILLWRYLVKYFYFTIPGILLLVLSLVLFNNKSDNYLIRQFNEVLDLQKSELALTGIQTLDDEVVITYKGNIMSTKLNIDSEGYVMFEIKDDDGNMIPLENDPNTGNLTIQDPRFPNFTFSIITVDNKFAYEVAIDGKEWIFINQTEDGTYYHFNQFNRLDKIITAPSAVFTGYERYASGRGYIWSRSIPLLKENFFLGSGADTFVIEFPQQDYVNKFNYGYSDQLITKPHNMYLQMGVQTGTLSLLAFLVFYAIYFISSIKLYIRSRYDNFYSRVGVAIFVGTFSYMVAGIANDSSVTIAPLFWVMMGLGIVVNEKAKSIVSDKNNK